MRDSNELLGEADSLLEENRFSEARDAYRHLLISEEFSRRGIANLGVAEREDCMEFLRELVDRYPEEVNCVLAAANGMSEMGRPDQGMRLCATLLQRDITLTERFLVQTVRLRLAASCGQFADFVGDCREIWNAGAAVPGSVRFRPGLLNVIAGLTDPGAIPVLEVLAEEIWVAGALREFISAKMVELRTMAHVRETA